MQKNEIKVPLGSLSSGASTVSRVEDKAIKVLLIDEDPAEAYMIREKMSEAEAGTFALEYSDRLSTGLERLAKGGIDVLLLDIGLPDGQGLNALARLRNQATDVPIIVLASLGDETRETEALQKGAQEFLVKHQNDGNSLVHSIYRAIERQRTISELEREISRLESQEAYLQNIIRSNADGIIIVDHNGIMRFVNPATESLFGCTAEELLGELFDFTKVAGKTTELNIVRRNGETAVAEIRVVETEFEGEVAYLASLRDITERKQAEEEGTLAREEAAASVRAANEAAEAAKKASKASEEAISRAKEESRLAKEADQT